MRYVSIEWGIDEGYNIVPTINSGKKGFVHLEEEAISIGKKLHAGDLARAIRSAISLSK